MPHDTIREVVSVMRVQGSSASLVAMLVFVFVLGSVTPAAAQQKMTYWGINVGAVSADDMTIRSTNTDIEYDAGYKGSLLYGFPGNWVDRWEAEFAARKTGVDKVGGSNGQGGDLRSFSFLFNGYYDFGAFYLGGGLGWARADLDEDGAGSGGTDIDDTDEALAFQGMTGLRWMVSSSSAMTFGYKYTSSSNLEFQDGAGARLDVDGLSDHQLEMAMHFGF